MKLSKLIVLVVLSAAAGGALAQEGGGSGPPRARKLPATVPAKGSPPVSAPAPTPKAAKPARVGPLDFGGVLAERYQDVAGQVLDPRRDPGGCCR